MNEFRKLMEALDELVIDEGLLDGKIPAAKMAARVGLGSNRAAKTLLETILESQNITDAMAEQIKRTLRDLEGEAGILREIYQTGQYTSFENMRNQKN